MAVKITVTDLCKAFSTPAGPLPVLANVGFTVADGEFVAIIGPSGCGKSTLLNILAGFDRPDRGEVLVDDQPVTGPSRRGIFIFQKGSLFPWRTVRGNLAFGLDGMPRQERRRLVDHYMAVVGLQGFDRVYPYQLSGGMQQRLEVARALAVKPEVLYMDEPFGALDALTRLRMRNELLRILSRERHTVVLVTHDVEEALQLADRIVILSPRPAKVQSVVDVPIPHPRPVLNLGLVGLKDRILHELGVDYGGAPTVL